MPSSRFSWGLLCCALSAGGCVLVVPFEYGGEGPGQGGGGATPSAGGQGAGGDGGAGAGGEGSGGRGVCAGLDLQTDEQHCGVCEFECGRERCVDGRCAEVVDVGGGDLRSVRVVGDKVFFSQKPAGADAARLRVLPIDFIDDQAPGLDHAVENEVGTLVASIDEKRVYFAPQNTKLVYACDEADCEPVDLGTAIAFQTGYVMAPTADRLYFGDSTGGRLLSMAIGADGVPITGNPAGTAVTVEVASHAAPFGNGGIDQVRFQPPDRLVWSSLTFDGNADGCIFTALIADLAGSTPETDFECWSARFPSAGFTVSAAGDVYAQDGWNATTVPPPVYRVRKFAAGSAVETIDFATAVTAPRGVDEDWLYALSNDTGAINLHPLSGGAPVLGPNAPLVMEVDVSHPDYVFYTEGSRLHRWVKPRR